MTQVKAALPVTVDVMPQSKLQKGIAALFGALPILVVVYLVMFKYWTYPEGYAGVYTSGKVWFVGVFFVIGVTALYLLPVPWLILPCGPAISFITADIVIVGGQVWHVLANPNNYPTLLSFLSALGYGVIRFFLFPLWFIHPVLWLSAIFLFVTGFLAGVGSFVVAASLNFLLRHNNELFRTAAPPEN